MSSEHVIGNFKVILHKYETKAKLYEINYNIYKMDAKKEKQTNRKADEALNPQFVETSLG